MTDKPSKRYLATVGMFDGVHRGHVFVLNMLEAEAARRGLTPLALTFSQHPMTIVAPISKPALLSSPQTRKDLIESVTNVEVRVLDTNRELLAMTGADFLAMLHRDYGVEAFMMGFNNHIGSDRADAEALSSACIPVLPMPPLPEGDTVNSTAVRAAISEASFAKAHEMLGHDWRYRGLVVEGKQLGRTIGFPTANIEPDVADLILPPSGVYAVEVHLDPSHTYRGMANIGHRPTVDAPDAPKSFEINIFDYNGDLYGKYIEVSFLARLRSEQHFTTIEALRSQLEADRDEARNINFRP